MMQKIIRFLKIQIYELWEWCFTVAFAYALHSLCVWMNAPLWIEITLISTLVADRYITLDKRNSKSHEQ
jgi:hypothetical protein